DPLVLFYLGVVDRQQHVRATISPCAQAQANVIEQVEECTPQDPTHPLSDGFTAPILADLGGDTQQAHWIAVSAQGILIAVPIPAAMRGVRSVAKGVVGALVAVISLPGSVRVTSQRFSGSPARTGSPTPSSSPARASYPIPSDFSRFLLGIFWDQVQVDGLFFILLASVIGTLAGLLITRNVSRRLRHITRAADAWSQ